MELQEISDRLEIADVLTRYTRAIDTGDWDRLDTVFTPDAQIDYTESGGIAATYVEIKPWLIENLPIFPQRMHLIGQLDIEFQGADDATVVAYFDNPMTMPREGDKPWIVEIGGMYHHDLVRTPDGWRSRRLHEQVIWKRGI